MSIIITGIDDKSMTLCLDFVNLLSYSIFGNNLVKNNCSLVKAIMKR